MRENSWALLFLKPEEVTDNTAALLASEAGIIAHWYCQNEIRNKLMNTSLQKRRTSGSGPWPAMQMDIHPFAWVYMEPRWWRWGSTWAEHARSMKQNTLLWHWSRLTLFSFSFSSNRKWSFFLIWAWSLWLILQAEFRLYTGKGQKLKYYFFCTVTVNLFSPGWACRDKQLYEWFGVWYAKRDISAARLDSQTRSDCTIIRDISIACCITWKKEKIPFQNSHAQWKINKNSLTCQCCSGSLNAVTIDNLKIMLTIQQEVSANICEERQLPHKRMQSKNMSHAQAILLWAIKSLYESYR